MFPAAQRETHVTVGDSRDITEVFNGMTGGISMLLSSIDIDEVSDDNGGSSAITLEIWCNNDGFDVLLRST